MKTRIVWFSAFVLVCPGLFAQYQARLLTPAASPPASNVDRTIARPAWATPERLRGRVEDATAITVQVHLALRNLEAAKAELEAVNDPDSPRYGQYLTSEEFESRYSPTVEVFSAVQSYLESEGFAITYVPRNRLFVSARASAAQVEQIFSTRLGRYEVGGELRRAPIEAAHIPTAIAPMVSGVLGLSTERARPRAVVRDRGAVSGQKVQPSCSDYYGQYFDTIDPPYGGGFPNPTPLHSCGLTPPRVRRAYGLDDAVASGNDGRGVRIAIVDAWRSPTLVTDTQAFAEQYDPGHPLLGSQITLIDAPSGGDPPIPADVTWYYEQLLDVESAHAVAPGAHIVFVGAATAGYEDLVADINFIVQDKLASIVSNSWGFDPDSTPSRVSEASLLDPILIQAGLKGIGIYFASGDSGDNQCGSICYQPTAGSGPSVDYPASSPFTIAVGGTSLYLGPNDLPAYETGWETGESVPTGNGNNQTWAPPPPGLLFFGAGGGASHLYLQPSYQRNVVPPALAGATPARVIPDVAMLADVDSGVKLGLTDPFLGTYIVYQNAGGTSLATPLFAATMALAEQRAGHRLGFANPKLYRVSSTAFRDIVPTPTAIAIAQPGVWLDTEDPPNLSSATARRFPRCAHPAQRPWLR